MLAEAIPFGAADVTNGDREQIHIPGSVQPQGCLPALDSSGLRIGRERHGNLGQYLTTTQLALEGITRDKTTTISVRERIKRLKNITADAGYEVNTLAWQIRPASLDGLGLQTASQQFHEAWTERSNLQFDLHLALKNQRLEPAFSSALYRALQEAIHNAVKQADAMRVGEDLKSRRRQVTARPR